MDKAILPIENSVGGSIHRNYDLLLRHRLHIVGEVKMVVNHCLLGLPGVRKEELNHVLSHPQVSNYGVHSNKNFTFPQKQVLPLFCTCGHDFGVDGTQSSSTSIPNKSHRRIFLSSYVPLIWVFFSLYTSTMGKGGKEKHFHTERSVI